MTASTSASTGSATSRTYLTMRLDGEGFALGVDGVQEIIDPLPMVRVPRAGRVVPGLINVRGSVVPVFDLRERLGMPPAERTVDSRMVVLESTVDGEPTKLAIEADAVEKVTEISPDRVEPVPEIGIAWPPAFLDGVAKLEDRLIILLRSETLFDLHSKAT